VAHPYYAPSAPAERNAMLGALGLSSPDELYSSIPERLLLKRPLDMPPGITAESDLERHLEDILARDVTFPLARCFRGGGCWPHHVPEVCLEIVNRAEFRTAYWAAQYTDHGKWQAFFEYASLLGELLEMDAVSLPTYDWANAAATAVRMACRITGRRRIVVAGEIGLQRLGVISRFASPELELIVVPISPASGRCDLDAVGDAVAGSACLYFENPGYLGLIETDGRHLCDLAHQAGALAVVGTDPISLGLLAPPAGYGADIACGDLQPLGVPMQFGGGLSGFIASADGERFIGEYPGFLIGISPTGVTGELGFGFVDYQRTSFMRRDLGKDFGGTTTNLWAIAAAVYMSLLGPTGMQEVGEVIHKRAVYAAQRIGSIPGVRCPMIDGAFFKEFVAGWSGTGLTAAEINRGLAARGYLGGIDLSLECPQLGQSTLFCVTEVHQQRDIDGLVAALREVVAA
jgi:glycine dehydrogenase subunit 1